MLNQYQQINIRIGLEISPRFGAKQNNSRYFGWVSLL